MFSLAPTRFVCKFYRPISQILQQRYFKRPDTPNPDPTLLHKRANFKDFVLESPSFPGEFDPVPPKGRVYDDKAFPMTLEANKEYKWCTCGVSKSQPMCDNSHRRLDGTNRIKKKPLFKPLPFKVTQKDIYHICNCKQTSNPPFCDGTHREKFVQESHKNRS